MGRYTGKKCRLISMFWLTTFIFLVEIVVGYVTNSMALVADSFHMLSDVAALVIAFLSVKVSSFYFVLTVTTCKIVRLFESSEKPVVPLTQFNFNCISVSGVHSEIA
jgi:uncharacterized membrane protein